MGRDKSVGVVACSIPHGGMWYCWWKQRDFLNWRSSSMDKFLCRDLCGANICNSKSHGPKMCVLLFEFQG